MFMVVTEYNVLSLKNRNEITEIIRHFFNAQGMNR